MNQPWCILHCYIVAGNLLNSKPCCIFCYSTVLKIATARFFATAQFSKLLRHGFFLLRHSFQNCYSTLFCYGTVLKIATAQFARFFFCTSPMKWFDLWIFSDNLVKVFWIKRLGYILGLAPPPHEFLQTFFVHHELGSAYKLNP